MQTATIPATSLPVSRFEVLAVISTECIVGLKVVGAIVDGGDSDGKEVGILAGEIEDPDGNCSLNVGTEVGGAKSSVTVRLLGKVMDGAIVGLAGVFPTSKLGSDVG